MPSADRDGLLKCAEYLGLRAEIIDWQNRRWLTVGFTATLFVFVITQIARIKSESSPDILYPDILYVDGLSIGFAAYLSVAWSFVVYARNSNALLSAYIDVFLESVEGRALNYENRLQRLNKNKHVTIDTIILALFIILLLATIGAACWVQLPNMEFRSWIWVAGVPAGLFIVVYLICYLRRLPRDDAKKQWEEIKDQEPADVAGIDRGRAPSCD